jgi:hypothetical protein
MMLIKKQVFGNWIEHHMFGDYCLMNKQMHSNKHVMPLLKKIFNALGQAKVFNILNLHSSYH